MSSCPKAWCLDILSSPPYPFSKDLILSIRLGLSNLPSYSPKLQTWITNSYLTITWRSNKYLTHNISKTNSWSPPESLNFTSVSPILVMLAPHSRCLGQKICSHPLLFSYSIHQETKLVLPSGYAPNLIAFCCLLAAMLARITATAF